MSEILVRRRRPRRRLASAIALTVAATAAIVVVDVVPAAAECASIPATRDINVTRKVYEVGQRRGVSDKVMLAGFETGWVESHMNNLPCGDRDSLGVFQQRPSQGWGTPAQVQNVDYAANTFFAKAQRLEPSYRGRTAGELAQAVQVSAFPDRYDQSEGLARQMMNEAFQPYGTIGAKWHSLGGAGGPLGAPDIRAEADARLGARFTQFQHGIVIWRPNVAHAIYGRILDRWWATDSEVAWGFPTMDELPAAASPAGTTGRYQYFEKALFLWSEATDAHLLRGDILKAFEAGGREAALGYPTMDEADAAAAPDGTRGRYQYLESALALWSPSKGGHLLKGEILKAFEANGREALLGYPTGPQVVEGSGIAQPFQAATVHWTAERGAWITRP